MNNRTPLLLGALGLVAVVLLGDQMGMLAFIEDWGKAGESQLAKVQNGIKVANDMILKGKEAEGRLEAYQARSLPYDPAVARSKYQAWLTSLVVEQNRFEQSSVEVATPASVTVKDDAGKKVEAYRRYGFTINGAGRLEQLTQFLFDFYRAGHLHRINNLSLTKSSGGRFNVSIAGEAIGLASTERKDTLAETTTQRLAFARIEDYDSIVRRNVFSREVGATLKLISVSSVTYDRTGLPEAWFKVGKTQETRKLQRGSKLSVSVHEIEVIDIQPRSVLVEVDGAVLDLPLGKSVHEAMKALEVAALPSI